MSITVTRATRSPATPRPGARRAASTGRSSSDWRGWSVATRSLSSALASALLPPPGGPTMSTETPGRPASRTRSRAASTRSRVGPCARGGEGRRVTPAARAPLHPPPFSHRHAGQPSPLFGRGRRRRGRGRGGGGDADDLFAVVLAAVGLVGLAAGWGGWWEIGGCVSKRIGVEAALAPRRGRGGRRRMRRARRRPPRRPPHPRSPSSTKPSSSSSDSTPSSSNGSSDPDSSV